MGRGGLDGRRLRRHPGRRHVVLLRRRSRPARRRAGRMRLLLDTHAVLWWLGGSTRLGAVARERIADGESFVAVSAVSLWEIEIKRSIGKLRAPADVLGGVRSGGFELLALTPEHAVAAGRLPMLHRDPFDRAIVAQARLEGLTVVTGDRRVADYDVPVLPAEE
ncbi:type II toxin-antitoxin system VapC family toxin [Patulibacter americanus]|uniref:type II toxin-antitoxin system VapC family toxin n=1 Tax=Patulibacter americanus TaxID=588672 RepID=UPI00316ADF99